MYYYAIDGDDIGRKLEKFILNNDISAIKSLSDAVRMALDKIANYAKLQGAEIIFCEGDSILFYTRKLIEIPKELLLKDNISFSMGIGTTPSLALLALKKAKGLGKKQTATFLDYPK